MRTECINNHRNSIKTIIKFASYILLLIRLKTYIISVWNATLWTDKKGDVQGLWKKRTVSINFSCCPWALKCPSISSLSLRTCSNLPAACTNTDTNGWPALASLVKASCSIWWVWECIVTVTTAHLKSSLSYLTNGSPRGVAHNVIVWRLKVSGSEIKWFRMNIHLGPRG